MTATTASIEVREYLAAVSRELADLPADERDDLLEDLDSHLHEVIAEGEGSLEQRLGPPAQYAAELRASAGLSSSERLNGECTAPRRELIKRELSMAAHSRTSMDALHPCISPAAAARLVDRSRVVSGWHHRRRLSSARFQQHKHRRHLPRLRLMARRLRASVHRHRLAGGRDSDLDPARTSITTRQCSLARYRGQRRRGGAVVAGTFGSQHADVHRRQRTVGFNRRRLQQRQPGHEHLSLRRAG